MHLLVSMTMLIHQLQLLWVTGWCLRPPVSAQVAPVHAGLDKSFSASLAMGYFEIGDPTPCGPLSCRWQSPARLRAQAWHNDALHMHIGATWATRCTDR